MGVASERIREGGLVGHALRTCVHVGMIVVCALLCVILAACAQGDQANVASDVQASDIPAQQGGETAVGAPAEGTSRTAERRAEAYRATYGDRSATVAEGDAGLELVGEAKPASDRYTLMVYMVGSNLESTLAAATHDLAEMAESGIDFSRANVVVYAGGSRRWSTDIPADRNSVLDLSRPVDERIVAQTASSVSMGASQTLAGFLSFCVERYPAEHMALVLWDHGGGPLWGFGNDEMHEGDGLFLSELRDALDSSPFGAGGDRHLDWVGFDACLMGSLESAVLWSDYADWLVASEEVEPGDGWDYGFLSTLNETVDPKAIGSAILDSYDAHYRAKVSTLTNPDVTLALWDLAKTKDAVSSFDDLMLALEAEMREGGYALVNRARRAAKAFGLRAASDRSSGYDLVDLVDLADAVAERHPQEAAALTEAVEALVVKRVGNVGRAHGVSLYFPGDNRELFETFDGRSADAGGPDDKDGSGEKNAGTSPEIIAPSSTPLVSRAYDGFVDAYTDTWLSASDVDWTLPVPELTAQGVELRLGESQLASVSSVSYTLLQEAEGGTYYVRTGEVEVPVDAEGVARVPLDPPLIAVKTDLKDPRPCWVMQVEDGGEKATYATRGLWLAPAGDFTDLDETCVSASVSLSVVGSTGEVGIESVVTGDGSVGAGGRSTVDVSEYSGIFVTEFGGGMVHLKRDAQGLPLPWDQWESGGFLYGFVPVEDGFGFVSKPASNFMERCAVQLVVTDVNGARHATEPVSMELPRTEVEDERTVVRETDMGTLTLKVRGDHAEVAKYEGEDWTVEIPTEVEGIPVTTIATGAFSGAAFLDELTVPEGIEDIGAFAISNNGISKLRLPSTLRHVAPAAFHGMPYLAAFEMEGPSSAASVRDGVLFSGDGTTLLSYPNARGSEYEVPMGTEELGYGCFAKTDIERVTLPEGLTSIGRAAFYGCVGLREVGLPRSLERIGTYAFGAYRTSVSVFSGEGAPIDRVTIGPKVSYVGPKAFCGLDLTSIEVDPANTHYRSVDGCLLNAAGDAILEAPRGLGGIVAVPEGVVTIAEHAFTDFPEGADFILPSTLQACEEPCFPFHYEDDDQGDRIISYDCTVHAPVGSYAERFATDRKILGGNETDLAMLASHDTEVELGDIVLAFRVYGDHATLVAASDTADWTHLESGSTHELAIPDEVEGKPVTAIDLDLRYEFENEDIGTFYSARSIVTLTLPSALASVGDYGFFGFSGLKRMRLDEANEHFVVVDDVLLSADGTVLVVYPAGREGTYEVPDGVKRIGGRAFCGADVTELTLPDSVEELGEGAFENCDALVRVTFGRGLEIVGESCFDGCGALRLDDALPDSVTQIGEGAFDNLASYEGLVIPEDIEVIGRSAFNASYAASKRHEALPVPFDTLAIGPYAREIGSGAFSGLGFVSFEVDEENDAFRAAGPFLLSADGTEVVAFASGFAGEAKVPDGVRELDLDVFDTAFGLEKLVLPASVDRLMAVGSSKMQEEPFATLVLAGDAGSRAEQFAHEEGFVWERS